MSSDDVALLREALGESKGLARDLWVAYQDQMERTARLTQAMTLGMAGQLAVVTLVVQAGLDAPVLAITAGAAGLVATLGSAVILMVAQVNLPSDSLWSWGTTPWVYVRQAHAASGDDGRWTVFLVGQLAERVDRNAQVIVLLLKRRTRALVVGALGWTAFLFGALYIVGGQLLA